MCGIPLQAIRQVVVPCVPMYWAYKVEMISTSKATTSTGRKDDNVLTIKDES